MSTYFWNDEGKGWTFTGTGRHWPTYASMYEAYLADRAVHPSSGDVFADLGIERPDFCEDEGCPQHGTLHVCNNPREQITELSKELGVEDKPTTVFRAALDVAKNAVAAVTKPTLEQRAKAAYEKHTDNHPTIHSNRFPSWEELSNSSKQNWRNKVEEADHEEQVLAQPLRKNGVPIEGALAYREGHPVEACPYSSTSSQDYEAHTRWIDEWSRASMDDNNETDNKGPVLPV